METLEIFIVETGLMIRLMVKGATFMQIPGLSMKEIGYSINKKALAMKDGEMVPNTLEIIKQV